MRFDGQIIVDAGDLPHVVGMMAPGENAQVEIYREGKRKKLTMKVGSLDTDRESITASSDGTERLGLIVAEMDDEERRALRLRGGVRVTQVSPESAAAESMLQAGDIVVQLGYSRIDDIDEYNQVIAELPKNTPVAIRFYRQGRAIFRTFEIIE